MLDRIGLDAIVDVHTHFMPKRVMDKVWAYFDRIGPQVGRQWPIEYRTDEAERVQRLRQFRVTAFTSLVYPHKPAMAEWLNSWATHSRHRSRSVCTPQRSIPSRRPLPMSGR